MGNEQSTAKIIAMARQRNDLTLSCGGEELRAEWIPDNAITLGLKNLKLTSMKLEICPPIIFQADDIVNLSLADNRLVTIANIHFLVNLENLDLSGNCLEFLSDDIAGLKNLKSLNVSKNKLTSRGFAPGIYELTLESLDISQNKFVESPPDFIEFIGRLKDVKLQDNPWANENLLTSQTGSTAEPILGASKGSDSILPPVVPPKKKLSKKMSLQSVQRENSLKSISEQGPPEIEPSPVAIQSVPRISAVEIPAIIESPTNRMPEESALSVTSDVERPSSTSQQSTDGPTRTGVTLKPMSRAKGPKKKTSISEASANESKGPTPRSSTATQASSIPNKKGSKANTQETESKAAVEELKVDKGHGNSISKSSKIASFFKSDKQDKQSKEEKALAEAVAAGPPPMPPKHTKPSSRSSRVEEEDDEVSISSEASRISTAKKSGGVAPQIDMGELKLRQRKLTDAAPAASITSETTAPPGIAPQIDMAELKLKQQRKVTSTEQRPPSIAEATVPTSNAPQIDIAELKSRQQRKTTGAAIPEQSVAVAPLMDINELKQKQQRKVTDSKQPSTAPEIPAQAPQVDMAELKLKQQRKASEANKQSSPNLSQDFTSSAPQLDIAELKLKQQKKAADAKLAQAEGSSTNAPQIDINELKNRQQQQRKPNEATTAVDPPSIVSPTTKSATSSAAPAITPRPPKEAPSPTAAAPALAPRPVRDASKKSLLPTEVPQSEQKAPQLPPKGEKMHTDQKAPQLPVKNDKLQSELKPLAKEANPEPEAEPNSTIPPWKLEMERKKKEKAAQAQAQG